MNRNNPLIAMLVVATLGACSSGDINISPATTISGSNNTTTTGSAPAASSACASYVNSGGQTIQGVADGNGNCVYGPGFASNILPLQADMTISALENGGAHIFEASLFVGKSYRTDAEMQTAGIFRGGDGPTLTVEAGTTLAFKTSKDFLVINRGSRIIAIGRADAPITITSESDVSGTVGPEDVQQWGGMVIDGFGVTNKCSYTGTRGVDLALVGECHVDSEGSSGNDENQYGGNNDDDSSGQLEYVVVKHTGATVGNGDELNGITFGAVGRNTIIRNLEMYSTYDDGIEMFGGSVNFENYVAVYVRDDSIDIDEGWNGSITNALVIQSETDGNNCIEADGIGSFSSLDPAVVEDFIARGLQSSPTISHLTCIVSPNGAATATHDPGAGWRFREGITPTINDALLIASFGVTDATNANDNYCLRIDNRSQQAALDGELKLNSVLYSCGENTRGQTLAGSTVTEEAFATNDATYGQGGQFHTVIAGSATSATAQNDAELQLLGGPLAIGSLPWNTSMINGAVPTATSQPTAGPASHLGALADGGVDWTAGWTYGIHPDNRAQALWFESL
ncbi:MAG: serine/threonine protein kinase [Gammaproteobacteria bacterium]|nr:serine/threonine protein kinase [Gammaproteobacteria bacterium]